MPGYIHTCASCGAHMQVHERYLGRTLKCTSCRTEFEAALPEDALVEEPLPPVRDAAASSPSVRRFVPWLLLLLVPVAALTWFLGQDQSKGPAGTLFREKRSVGENATVDAGSGRPVLVALDHEAVGALLELEGGAVTISAGSLKESGRYIELPAGTSVRVLEYASRSREARIRVLEGPWQSRIVWIPSRWIR